MGERSIGIRALKSRLSECVREVKTGLTIIVTERGRPVARIIPDAAPLRERLAALRKSGGVLWSGRRLRPTAPVARVRGKPTIADLISENRE